MSENSKIEWTDHTINMWWGCTKISPGCAHCYADALAHRYGKDVWGPGKPREDHRKGATKTALKLNAQSQREGRRYRVFSASMSDWLDDEVPIEWLADLLKLIHDTPNLDWLLLTKRPQNWSVRLAAVLKMMSFNGAPDSEDAVWNWLVGWQDAHAPANVWIGTTVEDQTRADERIPQLLAIPAKVRFLSCEPLLKAVHLGRYFVSFADIEQDADLRLSTRPGAVPPIDWVICGGESGQRARPMQIEWAQSLADQCAAAGVPFFMKQLGGVRNKRHNIEEFPETLRIRQFPAWKARHPQPTATYQPKPES